MMYFVVEEAGDWPTASNRGSRWYRATNRSKTAYALGYPSRDINDLEILAVDLAGASFGFPKTLGESIRAVARVRVSPGDAVKVVSGKLPRGLAADYLVGSLRKVPYGYVETSRLGRHLAVSHDHGDDVVTRFPPPIPPRDQDLDARVYGAWVFNARLGPEELAMVSGWNARGTELEMCSLRVAPGVFTSDHYDFHGWYRCDIRGSLRMSDKKMPKIVACRLELDANGVDFGSNLHGCELGGVYRDCVFANIIDGSVRAGTTMESCKVDWFTRTELFDADMLGTTIGNLDQVKIHRGALRGAILDGTGVRSRRSAAQIDALLAACVDAPTGGVPPRYRETHSSDQIVHTWAVNQDREPVYFSELDLFGYRLERAQVRASYRAKVRTALAKIRADA